MTEYSSTELMQMVIGLFALDINQTGYCKCPSCDSNGKKRRLNIELSKGVFRCNKCGQAGNAVHLYAWLKDGIAPDMLSPDDRKEYFKQLLKETGHLEAHTFEPVENIPQADLASLEDRDETYTAMLKRLGLNKIHYENLIKRGLRKEDIVRNGYKSVNNDVSKSICTELRGKDACTLKGVPGFFRNKSTEKWELKFFKSGFFIPIRTVSEDFWEHPQGKIQGCQIRFDDPKDGPRYNWMSSAINTGNKDKFMDGCKATAFSHFVGYPEKDVILTEGALKGDIINRFTNSPVLCVPGVNSISTIDMALEPLKKYGVGKFLIAFDMDLYEKVEVKKALDNLIEVIKSRGFEFELLKWNTKYKGMDDYLLAEYLKKGGKLDNGKKL